MKQDGQPAAGGRRIPGFLFRRAYQATNALWSMHVGDTLTSPQYAVIASLYRLGPIDQISLTGAARIDRSTLADILTRLDARGLTVRMRDAADGRRNLVSLSEAGRTLYEEVTPGVERVDAELMAALEVGDVERFLDQLAAVVKRAERMAEMHKREQGARTIGGPGLTGEHREGGVRSWR